MKKILNFLFFLGIVELTVQPAHAYLDPGTGSVVVQTIIATVVAAGFVIKGFWYKIIRFINVKKISNNEKMNKNE